MAGDQPVLHAAICRVCRATLPGYRRQGRREGAQAGRENGEGPGEGVYAGVAQAHGDTEPQGYRH